jgi:hypothetical protein
LENNLVPYSCEGDPDPSLLMDGELLMPLKLFELVRGYLTELPVEASIGDVDAVDVPDCGWDEANFGT